LRELLIEAVRYGEQPGVRARLTQVIANAVDRSQLENLLEERALAHDAMDASGVRRIREEMERAEARRLQPHYVESFFLEAFQRLGGTAKQREPRRYEVTHVPAPVRNRDRLIGIGEPVLPRYERIAFEKPLVAPQGLPLAAFVCPGHPLLDATIDLTLERHRDLLRRGTVLVDERDPGTEPRILFYLEHAIQDASLTRSGERRIVSKRMLYVELAQKPPGTAGVPPALPWHSRGYLPHFDQPGLVQSITFRLHDAVPMELIAQWQMQLNWMEGLPATDPREVEIRERLGKFEDSGHGACWLRDDRIAALVQNALQHFDGERYRLIAWCIMPNHVHVLLETVPVSTDGSPTSLSSIVHSWKSYTAHEANRILRRSGDFWFREYYDRFIRDEKHFRSCKDYIEQNPVKAGLVSEKEAWRWSSAGKKPDAAETAAVPGGGFHARHMHYAPYLDYRPLAADEPDVEALLARPECSWISRDLEQKAQGHAVANVVPDHLSEVRSRKLELIAKTEAAVKDRLTKEISYWDHRAEQLKLQEQANKPNARLNSGEARKRADALQARLEKRMEDLKLEAQISPLPPVVLGGLLVVPAGLIASMTGRPLASRAASADHQAAAARARAIVMEIERGLGFDPTDREVEKLGYDIESRVPGTGKLRFIEVKGRDSNADTITVTKNEILYSLNKPDDFILAIVEFQDDGMHRVHYLRQPFRREPDFGVTSVNYDFAELIARAEVPA
jgi:REP element-mobilizing transposase RayT